MVEDIEVQFPYPRIYPEQYAYMLELKRSLDAKGHSMLEMPTGTGKTITLLSLITSYQRVHRETIGKLIYCTRTIPEMEKVLEELAALEAYRDECFAADRAARNEPKADRPDRLLGVGLTSRRNLCVHERVSQQTERTNVDQECRQMTAGWVRDRAKGGAGGEAGSSSSYSRTFSRGQGGEARGGGAGSSAEGEAAEARGEGESSAEAAEGNAELCSYFENLEAQGTDAGLPRGVFTLEQLKEHAKARGFCPYFLARQAIQIADVVVYNYQYLLDPKISTLISSSLQRECVVVFDEAHNIDNICIEVMSINFRVPTLEACNRNVSRMESEIARLKATDATRLNDEYQRLVSGLAQSGAPHTPCSLPPYTPLTSLPTPLNLAAYTPFTSLPTPARRAARQSVLRWPGVEPGAAQ